MSESLQTFMNIFQAESVKKIIIPKIQRDYAQGRNTDEIRRVRARFLDALYKAVTTERKIKLDFVYGDLSDDGILTPLDGQQRLTTLFLLHWYAAKKENISSEETACLENFSYDTRPDSREFCKFLIDAKVFFDAENLSEELENLSGFPLGWKKDPTVSSMLVMLDAIHEKFRGVENLWGKLRDGAISFYFLSIKDLGLTDELYVTMNSRGKPLTDFEHFKAEFKRKLDDLDRELSDRIILKIDTTWTDLLWNYRDENNLIDDGFLAYFGFLCDVILYRKGDTPQSKSRDPFDLLEEFFDGDALKNIAFMEKSFDCWCDLDKLEKISDFFADRVSTGSRTDKTVNKHAAGKIITYFDDANFFGDCIRSGKDFSLGKVVILYAFLIYLLNVKKISDADFRRRIRIVNNLVDNSRNAELSNSTSRNNGNRIPAMLEQVDSIIINGKILQRSEIKTANCDNFNEIQLKEEREKFLWTEKNPAKAESLFRLEDHYLLGGQIGIVGLEYSENFKRFISLFECDYDKITCALLAIGNYWQVDGTNGRRYQLGSTRPQSWQNLFHKSALTGGFDDTKEILEKLLEGSKYFTDNYLQGIIDDYLAACERKSEFDWKYYFIKYKDFRPTRYGRYWWENFEDEPYCFVTLHEQQKRTTNSYQPFLKAVDVGELSREYFGMRIDLYKYYVTCENDAYVVWNTETGVAKNRLTINQRGGIDTEDRIKKFKVWAEGYLI
ncbi:MAG: DUF262 domain-containing protein [Selenomonadaceae bacterium]|nr:DUF262 domain-containing protein [Selenomonadaceae bacterium]